MSSPEPQAFRPLDRAETDAILARNRVGRIAYTRRGRLDVEPVLYAFADGWIWARTSYGRAWAMLGDDTHGTPVHFEVDEVERGFRWRSVVVKGTLHAVEHPADGGDPAVWVHAVELIRALDPAAVEKVSALRTSLVRVGVAEAAGREGTGQG
jgi:nitroimidazol reductase NimA-like FMN-containing flavoprotein (pyridoxamine 5'-phosphate oxidase superfamily)